MSDSILVHRTPGGAAVGVWRWDGSALSSFYGNPAKRPYGAAVLAYVGGPSQWEDALVRLPSSTSPSALWTVAQADPDAALASVFRDQE